jgi:hypothetical protein
MCASILHPCPGCPASYPAFDGATHPYIGASAACWAVYSAMHIGETPDPSLIASSAADPAHDASARTVPGSASLLVDAYAAQHHGEPSPQAVQSVAVHLLVLHGVFERGAPVHDALRIRRRALRRKGVFTWLTPPPREAALSVRHCVAGGVVHTPMLETYVASVHTAWTERYGDRLRDWYERFVMAE